MSPYQKLINDFLHECHTPTCQCLKSYLDLSHNPSYRISPQALRKILDRLVELRTELLEIVNKEEK